MAFPSGSFDSVSDQAIEFQINVASNTVDGYLRTHHTLPLKLTSDRDIGLIKDCVLVIASYQLLQFRGFKPNQQNTPDLHLRERYTAITAPENGILAQLSAGHILLDREVDQTPERERRSRMISYGTKTATNGFIKYNRRGQVVIGV